MSLAEFIATRRREILEEIGRLQQELRELTAAEDTLTEVRVGSFSVEIAMPSSSYFTIREMALQVLESRPDGGNANQICEWIRESYAVDVPRTSLSPQLSRLRKAGHVVLDQRSKTWWHAKYIKAEDPNSIMDRTEATREAGA